MRADASTRIVDVDTHEMIPFHMWAEHFGEAVAAKLAACEQSPYFADNGANTAVRPDVVADDAPITATGIWRDKGVAAPGAIDLGRRCEVMDAMGVDRSLLFPSFGLIGILMASSPEFVTNVVGLGMSAAETQQAGVEVMAAYNDWVIRSIQQVDSRRVRPVGVMLTESVDQMVADFRHLVDNGVKAVWIPSGTPPAGASPADVALDPFWRLAADTDTAVLLHIGTDFLFASSPFGWINNVPAFVPPHASTEINLSAFAGSTLHIAAEHFLIAMTLGGVFERVPNLRFGAVELGAHWFGPLARRLDMWASLFPQALRGVIARRPSEYLARNVRVTPFHFEPVDQFFAEFPDLEECYCFSSDYPHVEGGKDAKQRFAERLAGFDDRVVERFFVTNGAWLAP